MKHQISLSVLAFLFLLLSTPLTAQKKRVVITDSGELYSTYVFSAAEEAEIRAQVSAATFEEIMKFHTEDSWPADIATLEARGKNRPAISSYVAYRIAATGGKSILLVPAKKNKKLPEGLRPQRNFYFVIGTEGIRL